jgi:Zn-dependent protease with chaperone function
MIGKPICISSVLISRNLLKPFIYDLYFSLTSSSLVMAIMYMISHMLKMWLMPIYVLIELLLRREPFQKKLQDRYRITFF